MFFLSALILMVIFGNISQSLAKAETVNPEVQLTSFTEEITKISKLPKIDNPGWLDEEIAKEKAASSSSAVAGRLPATGMVVNYSVDTRGGIYASVDEFARQVNETLNDGRGWSRLGVSFNQVASGGQFTVVLSEASQVPSFSGECSSSLSCRVGRYVIINQDRWLGATSVWNGGGGSLRDYRHMVINHETGHWLGHDHASCDGAGLPARIMQQQSVSLQGCTFNPWPTTPELWSTQLGVGI